MSLWMVSLCLAWWTGSGVAPAQAPKQGPPQLIRLYVFTNIPPKADKEKEKETEESDLKERVQATQDITNWLKDKKKKTISVVDTKDAADVVVEVMAVQHAPGMTLAERTAGYLHGPRYDTWTVRARVTAGTFSNELAKQGQFPALAAEMVADDVEKWTKDNREALVAARPKRDD
jgi:hypothetical protein